MFTRVTFMLVLLLDISCTIIPRGNWDREFCIIGAGPAGLQLGYFLEKSGMDYIIYERSNISGSFFKKYPRHGKLISINKRNTGSTNKEFNLRHDWNSLLSDDDSMLFKHYTTDLFPHKETMVRYLNDYTTYFGLNVQYNTEISNIRQTCDGGRESEGRQKIFKMDDQQGNIFRCRVVIVCTGLWKPFVPDMPGVELTEGYEDLSTDSEDYEAKSVLILGRGNSAFETADAIYSRTNYIHMIGRSRIRLAWETHYVGDLRAVNNGLLDTYQLKSLDGLLEYNNLSNFRVVSEGGKLFLRDRGITPSWLDDYDNDPLLTPYDKIIRCLGFRFDTSIFSNDTRVLSGPKRLQKYPLIGHDYQSLQVPELYFAGTLSHSLDYRRSAGGFIHGFRYTARVLYNILRRKYKFEKWFTVRLPIPELSTMILKRVNEASGLYQMYGTLGDVILIEKRRQYFVYLEEFPLRLLHNFDDVTGLCSCGASILVVALQYGEEYHGPQVDVFRTDRASTDPVYAHLSNFLHPVLYYYESLPTEVEMSSVIYPEFLPEPKEKHHMLEDFTTTWNRPFSHVNPLNAFLEQYLNISVKKQVSNQDCVLTSLTTATSPINCKSFMDSRPFT